MKNERERFLRAFWGCDELPKGVVCPVGKRVMTQDDKEVWPCIGWRGGSSNIGQVFHYWTPAIFEGARGQALKRRKGDVLDVFGIIADDVYEKAKPVPDLEPFARIETKPGSEQWVYRLTEGISADEATLIYNMLKQGGFSDHDGNNPVRLGRLPHRRPPPHKEFAAKVVEQAEVMHHPFDLILTIARGLTESGLKAAEEASKPDPDILRGSLEDIAEEDEVMNFLWARDMVLSKPRPGQDWWGIRCPFEEYHSENSESTELTAGYLPKAGLGAFRCHRGHSSNNPPPDLHVNSQAFRMWLIQQGIVK